MKINDRDAHKIREEVLRRNSIPFLGIKKVEGKFLWELYQLAWKVSEHVTSHIGRRENETFKGVETST